MRKKYLFSLSLLLLFCLGCIGLPAVLNAEPVTDGSISCSEEKLAAKKPDKKIVFQWHKRNLERHFYKHRAEFPEYKTAEEYGKAAVVFFSDPPKGTQFKRRSNGDRLLYYEKKNFFGAAAKNGFIKTFFRPNRGKNYWKRQ